MTTKDQYAFDTAINHLRKQKRASAKEQGTEDIFARYGVGSSCMYRSPDGLMCGIGPLIPDDEYTEGLEFRAVRKIIDEVPSLQQYNLYLLRQIQFLHDSLPRRGEWDMNIFEKRASELADLLGLVYTPPK